MGQLITVTEKRGVGRDMVRFELNRSLTGMGHHRFKSREDASGVKPVDEIARRLFDHGGVEAIHVFSNIITVDLAPRASTDGMADLIRDLFIYYREGVEVADPMAAPPPAAPS
jgi:hypothetical protein